MTSSILLWVCDVTSRYRLQHRSSVFLWVFFSVFALHWWSAGTFDTSPLSVFILLYIGGRVPQDHSDGSDGLSEGRKAGMQSAGGMQYVCLVAQSTTKVQSSFDFDFEQRGDQISIFWQACLLFISPSLVVIVVAALGSSWGSWIFLALRALFLSFFFLFRLGDGATNRWDQGNWETCFALLTWDFSRGCKGKERKCKEN